MIKLIASDMDGTLLDAKKQLPPDFIETLHRMKSKGAEFVVASGRSYITLKENFKEVLNDINYICDNGAYIVINGKVVNLEIINHQTVIETVKLTEKFPHTSALLCGLNGTYHLKHNKKFSDEVALYYVNQRPVDDLTKVEDDIFKIAVCDLDGPQNGFYQALNERFGNDFTVQITGPYWVDLMNKGVDKGMGLNKIQEYLGVSQDETMTFGDYYNDVELLQNAKYSYVMKNAPEDMFKYGNFVAPPNTEYGVTKVINEYFR